MAQRDDDQFEDGNQGFDDEAPAKSRKARAQPATGTNWGKIILILLGVGTVSLALCCGVGYYFANKAFNMTMDPAKITVMQKEIVEIEVPPGMNPGMGMNMNLGVMTMKIVAFNPNQTTSLMLMEMQISGQTEEQMKDAFSQQGNQQQNKQFRTESSESKTVKIDGVDRQFLFAKGTLTPQSGAPTPARMITGLFPSKTAMGFISYTIDETAYDEAAVIKTLESIHK